MRKLVSLLIVLIMLFGSAALAEAALTPLPLTTPDDPAAALDVVPHVPNPDLFTEDGYADESITVEMEHVMIGEARFSVAHMKISDPSQLRAEVEKPYNKNQSNHVVTMAERQHAVVAIGGDNYKGGSVKYIMRQGYMLRPGKNESSRDYLFIDANGDFLIRRTPSKEDFEAVFAGETPIVHSFAFGPALVIDGELQEFKDYKAVGSVNNKTDQRCAIGQIGPLEYLLVVVDGRGQGGSSGCDVHTVAQFMLDRGCVQAYNLDGGNSADMYFNGGYYSYEKKNPRSLSDIIYFATLVDAGLDAEAE